MALGVIIFAFLLVSTGLFAAFKQVFYLRLFFAVSLLTSSAFLTQNFILVLCILILISIWFFPDSGRGMNKLSMYFVFLPLLPVEFSSHFGGGGIATVYIFHYPELLVILLLLPMFFSLRKVATERTGYGKVGIFDILVVVYGILITVLDGRIFAFTNLLRGLVSMSILIIIPYFVISRYVNNKEDFFIVFRAICFSALLLAGVGVFSEILKWNFYSEIDYRAMNLQFSTGYFGLAFSDFRNGFLRIKATMSSPIIFGFFQVVAAACLFSMMAFYKKNYKFAFFLMFTVILINLFFCVSKGAYTGMAVFGLVCMYLYRIDNKPILIKLVIVTCLCGAIFYVYSMIGHEDTYGSFSYRSLLFEQSLKVIAERPLFGYYAYRQNPHLQILMQGQGIVDIVNSYLGIAMQQGLVTLLLFVLILFGIPVRLYSKIRLLDRKKQAIEFRIGVSLLALLLATAVMIATVSPISFLPVYLWSTLALSVAFLRMEM